MNKEKSFRVVALVASYNEERYLAACLEHLFSEGVEAYLIDNESTDRTVEIAERYRGKGLVGVETFPRYKEVYNWEAILKRKEELALSIEADWFIHQDVDEIRTAHRVGATLREAFEEVDAAGYNAVNFLELTFVPTREEPDHDHPNFPDTMRSYYPFMRNFPNQVKAWKNQPGRVEIAEGGGHKVDFPSLLLYPRPFIMRHYPYLSAEHFAEKYVGRKYSEEELERGWHGWRARLSEEKIKLPPAEQLDTYVLGEEPDLSNPRFSHVAQSWTNPPKDAESAGGDAAPIIVGGCFRSGTSLVRRILNSHSRIYCGPEVKFFRDFHNDYVNDPIKHGRFVESALKVLPEEVLMEELGGSFVRLQERAARMADKPRWADKNPENILHLNEWESLLGEEWVFVHVIRNPLDTLASIKEVKFPLVVPPDLDGRIALYQRYMRGGLEFQKRHPERYRRVFYEELARDPEGVASSLMEWLGEEFEPGQLNFGGFDHQPGLEDPKVSKTSEVHSTSVGRWREILTPEEAAKIEAGCGDLWRSVRDEEERPSTQKRLYRRIKNLLGGSRGGR